MEIERISICKEQCINEDCKNLHLNDPQLNYKIIMEKAKYQIKCQKGEACQNRGMCLDIHDGEIIPIFCEKKNCDKIDCIFTHEDDKFHSEIYQEKQQNFIEEANNYKNQGNQFFQENQYLQAIDSFTKAIQLNNKNSIYYSNRAMCYKKLKEWNNALCDAQSALSLDFQNLRARYLITISYVEIMKTEKNIAAIDILTKSLQELEKSIHVVYLVEKEAYLVQNLNFQNLNPEKQKVKYLIELYSKFQLEYTLLNVIERSFRPKEDKEKLQNVLWQKIKVFQNKPANKPEYMICPLTLIDFEEPIITTQGQTYEKTALFEHFKTNGHFDPITRNQINKNCIPNLQLVQAIQEYAKQNATLTMENIEFD